MPVARLYATAQPYGVLIETITEIRKAGDLGLPNCHCAQDVLKRLKKAFQAFFIIVYRVEKPSKD